MGILFLTTKQERCSDLLLWSAAWLLPPPMLRPIPTTATATDMVLALVATTVDMVLATPDMVDMVLATTARGLLRPSLRLMPSTDTELTPTPDSATDTLDSATATVLVLEPTEFTELTTVNFAQQQKLNTVSTVSSPVMGVGHLVLSGERESC